MFKKFGVAILAGFTALIMLPLFSAFEAHVINVVAEIENALFAHPASLRFGTVFPQEYFETSFFINFSESFSEEDQTRVGTVEYVLKQKPKPRPEKIEELGGTLAARDWCHENIPDELGVTYDPDDTAWQEYLENCYPTLCPYLSKHPDNLPSTGANANNDTGAPSFHDPGITLVEGKLVKFDANGTTIGNDPADFWTIDLPVPCFEGECAQDWAEFVHSHNPDAAPVDFQAPKGLSGEIFGCDIWVEVTDIY